MCSGCQSVTKSIDNLVQYRKDRGALFVLWIFGKPTVGSPAMAAKEEENKREPPPRPSDTRKLLSSIYDVFQELFCDQILLLFVCLFICLFVSFSLPHLYSRWSVISYIRIYSIEAIIFENKQIWNVIKYEGKSVPTKKSVTGAWQSPWKIRRIFVSVSLYDGLHLCDCTTSVQMADCTDNKTWYLLLMFEIYCTGRL